MAGKLTICSKLPHGLLLENPMNPNHTVEIKGVNSVSILGIQQEEFSTTMVDEDFWKSWAAVHKDFPAVTSGALFVANNDKDAKAIGREYSKRKSGFERLKPEDGGVKKANFSEDE